EAADLLKESAAKLLELQSIADWQNELLLQAPPILWFGNSKSEKPKILTFGANPSRSEFLSKNKEYLVTPRFYHLSENQTYEDIVKSPQVCESIIASYDSYFETNPYTTWFGNKVKNPYKVEAVLRGMNASYYNTPENFEARYQAGHIDIFPFATMSDFSKIKKTTERDILANDWAKNLVDNLIEMLNPDKILVFGLTNVNYFFKYFGIDKGPPERNLCKIWNRTYRNRHLIGISTNLGDPRNFSRARLNELGETLNNLRKTEE
ncbi:MAG: hypothetical protein LBI03_00130, partial [Clostridiales bacterium]|nr:hypothetical protein [Clostridiales bacterium]